MATAVGRGSVALVAALALSACTTADQAADSSASEMATTSMTDGEESESDGPGQADAADSTPRPLPSPTVVDELPDVFSALGTDPVVGPADEERFTNPGAVVHHDGRWVMLRNSFSAFPGSSQTDLLVSDDLTTWTPVDDTNPLYTSDDVPFARGNTFAMTAAVGDDGSWSAWLYDFNGPGQDGGIGRATAPGADGPWEVDAERVLEPGPAGSWYGLRVAEPSVVRHDGAWFLYFTGVDEDDHSAIGVATSSDGETWTVEPEPVVTGGQGWTHGAVGNPRVLHDGTSFVMVYDSASRGIFGLGLAFSSDGITWTPWAANPLLTPTDIDVRGFYQSAIVVAPDGPRLLLEVGSLGGTAVRPFGVDVDTARTSTVPRLETDVTVSGDEATIEVAVDGVDLRFDGESPTPGVAHPHAWVDRPPPPAGNEIPLDSPNVVHAPRDRLVVSDLAPGSHRIWIGLGDDGDRMLAIPPPVVVEVMVE